ncbi:MAG: SDR family oxidoreductase [Halieaceae bacterium]|jgi:meso-butanediol dehydrogenase / (S,S)-butanediol dehydrogenase / diacetyl reductase|nr:SDR family oxidoreductase [Halieaceae bacterium]
MADDLAGKVSIITGGASGYGYCIADQFVKAGAKVAIFSRTRDALDEAAVALGGDVLAVPVDISDPDSVRAGFKTVVDHFGQLNILINCAAIGLMFKVDQGSDQQIADMVACNLTGQIYCCREAIPLLRDAGGGVIVNISSESTLNPFPYMSVYAATKAGLETFTQGLRSEVAEDGIRVTLFRAGASIEGGNEGLKGSNFFKNMDPQVSALALPLWEQSGHMKFATGVTGGMDPVVLAESVLHVVTRSGNVNIDTVTARAL